MLTTNIQCTIKWVLFSGHLNVHTKVIHNFLYFNEGIFLPLDRSSKRETNHSGIEGNEYAGLLARERSSSPHVGPEPVTPILPCDDMLRIKE